MFIATHALTSTKLRRSGMYSSSLKRQNPRSCRSHGAWPIIWFGHYYKIGVGRAVARSPSLRTGLADLLHPALQSVGSR
jgi:hypothetical protein